MLPCLCIQTKQMLNTMNNLNGHFDSLNIKISMEIFLCMHASERASERTFSRIYVNRYAYGVYSIVCNIGVDDKCMCSTMWIILSDLDSHRLLSIVWCDVY